MKAEQIESLKKLAKKFVGFTFFFAIIITSSIIVSNNRPSYLKYTNNDWNYTVLPEAYNASRWNVLFDAHSHTLYSDGKLTVEQNILWHLSNGFNAIAISDHNTWKHWAEVKKVAEEKFAGRVLVLPASEWTTRRIHMNIILPYNATNFEHLVPSSSYPTNEEIKNTIQTVHQLGGVVMVNHYPWSLPRMPTHPTRQEVYEWGADFIEINEADWDQESVDFVAGNEMELMSGTDMHTPSGVNGWTALWLNEFTVDALFQQIKSRNTTVLFQTEKSSYLANHSINPLYTALRPMIEFGEIFENYMLPTGALDWVAISVFLGYYVVLFIVYEGGKELTKKIIPKLMKKQRTNQ